jgi:hypothetical protein
VLLNPDDSSASKSDLRVTEMGSGTEFFLEIRSEWNDGSNRRIGELMVWMGPSEELTVRIHDLQDG